MICLWQSESRESRSQHTFEAVGSRGLAVGSSGVFSRQFEAPTQAESRTRSVGEETQPRIRRLADRDGSLQSAVIWTAGRSPAGRGRLKRQPAGPLD